ncbi:hypothetical protein [Halalkalibacter hemicellulosilyticus]|uniref:Uncharacterized protein n=1 Tax=Halalkalibacter hemicellulosilyticusJCM 9152 TaxID=1236971 RepID=W4QG65_9BACI|nr:hypothetical protein [Halalkalibacter hemicellulosilyticus]GAE30643.1 hypothetical protein JCM9152_2057 [Halalkalibacter hemicellulosilyticusJCM 9152]
MIEIDNTYDQIVSRACLNCQDPQFQPPKGIEKVGCCSYSPTFQLLEISRICNDHIDQFWSIYHHPAAVIHPYSIFVKAKVDPSFDQLNTPFLTQLEKDDQQTSYSICHFFKKGKGCSLHPQFKNAVCRTFICTTIEEQLTTTEQKAMNEMIKRVYQETRKFQTFHSKSLKSQSLNLKNNPEAIVHYFQSIN